jgi:hypothetical protein
MGKEKELLNHRSPEGTTAGHCPHCRGHHLGCSPLSWPSVCPWVLQSSHAGPSPLLSSCHQGWALPYPTIMPHFCSLMPRLLGHMEVLFRPFSHHMCLSSV